MMKLENALAKSPSQGGVPVIWIAGAACTGCTMSLTNSVFYTTVEDLLLNSISLEYHETLMATAGQEARNNAQRIRANGGYVLIVEGAIPTGTPPGTLNAINTAGGYCEIGDVVGDGEPTVLHVVQEYAKNAYAVIGMGACACWGGIPAARGSMTGSQGLLATINYGTNSKLNGGVLTGIISSVDGKPVANRTINLPGCPPHPDWLVGTVASLIDTNLALPPMDSMHRPIDYYKDYQCNAGPCPWRYNNTYDRTNYNGSNIAWADNGYNRRYPLGNSRALGKNKWEGTDLGCLGIVGCKGRKTNADCSRRRWNTTEAESYGVNWCVGTRGGCHGCTMPGFPDKVGKLFTIA